MLGVWIPAFAGMTERAPSADVLRVVYRCASGYSLSMHPMHPMPPAEEFDRFVGDAIAQVRLDPYAVQFSMESMWTIYAMEGLSHQEATGEVWDYCCNAYEGGPTVLQRLLYKRITDVRRSDEEFTFSFEDGSALTIRTELGPYESGHIIAPNLTDCFIVF